MSIYPKATVSKRFDAFTLKIIAIVAMLIDHIGVVFFQKNPIIFTITEIIGYLTLPIMAFFIVEGYRHTRNVQKYMIRLLIFAIISIFPFDFMLDIPFTIFRIANNVLFTLFFGLLGLYVSKQFENKIVKTLCLLLCVALSLASNWKIFGVLTIYGFAFIKGDKRRISITLIALMIALVVEDLFNHRVFTHNTFACIGILLVIPLLLLYNGERGYSGKWVQWGFYAFYPIHMFILGLIRFWMHISL